MAHTYNTLSRCLPYQINNIPETKLCNIIINLTTVQCVH